MFLLPESPKPIKIFFAYSGSHQDEELRQLMSKHFLELKNLGVIIVWSQHQEESTKKSLVFENIYHLQTADVIVLLVSADFLALVQNQVDWNSEIAKLKEKHRLGEIIAVPVLLYQVHGWQKFLGNFTPLPKNGMPVKSWQNRDAALIDITQGIETIVIELKQYQERLQQYRYSFSAAIQQEFPFSNKALTNLNDIKSYLAVKNKDTILIEQEITSQAHQEYKHKLLQYKQELNYTLQAKRKISKKDREKLDCLRKYLGIKDEDIHDLERSLIPAKFVKNIQNIAQIGYRYTLKVGAIPSAMVAIGIALGITSITALAIFIKTSSSSGITDKLLLQGQTKFAQGDYQGAITAYTQAIKVEPQNIDAYIGRGNARSYLKNYPLAIQDYTKVINISSQSPVAYMNRAVVSCTLGNKQAAVKDYQQAANIYSQQGAANESKQALTRLNNLGICLPGGGGKGKG
jgi:tetratricopeptide (TPR) repeat protein